MATTTDYYSWLGLPRDTNLLDVKKAYRKLSLKFHPDKDASPEAIVRFAQVCEAYEVLSNPKLKGLYDLYGEQGLKKGAYNQSGDLMGGEYHFDPNSSPMQVFVHFFGTNNPYQALNDISTAFEELTLVPQPKEGRHKTHEVLLTLEEVFHGCVKKVQHERKILNNFGTVDNLLVELTIDVKPGTLDGTRFVFDGMGNQVPGETAGPAVYTLAVYPHERFHRKGEHLVHPVKLPLSKALSGCSLSIPTLDGRVLTVPVAEMITPGKTITVKGEGLPVRDGKGARGDLILEFELLFPAHLTDYQRQLLKAAFLLPKAPSAAQLKAVKAFESAASNPISGWLSGVATGDKQ